MITNSGLTVLFVEYGQGTVIKPGHLGDSIYSVGHYSPCWNISMFKNYDGSITLTQKL